MVEASQPAPPKLTIRLEGDSSWNAVPSTVPATLGCRHSVGQWCSRQCPSTTQTFESCWKWDHTNGGGHANSRANRFSPLTTEIDDEPMSGVPPTGVLAAIHPSGE